MNLPDLHYQIALTMLNGIGPRKAAHLVSKLGHPSLIFTEKLSSLHLKTGIGKHVLQSMKREDALIAAENQLNYIERKKVNTHFYLDTNYPRRLKQCSDAPLLLYSTGNFDPNPIRSVAIVGTRSATEYGKGLCEELVQQLANLNVQVVSGMAFGIDICAHKACLKHNIQTIGVLGHGLDRIYPSTHRKTAEALLENGGLLTEFLPGTKPDRENFPMRNRIVAGMTDATIVIESKKSGGSLITAELANDYSKDVFAYPGNVGQIHSEGCNLLIRQQKAHLITSGKDFLEEMNWKDDSSHSKSVQLSCFADLTETEQKICDQLRGVNGEHIDVIAYQLSVPVSQLSVQLFHLEMNGIVRSLPGKKYILA